MASTEGECSILRGLLPGATWAARRTTGHGILQVDKCPFSRGAPQTEDYGTARIGNWHVTGRCPGCCRRLGCYRRRRCWRHGRCAYGPRACCCWPWSAMAQGGRGSGTAEWGRGFQPIFAALGRWVGATADGPLRPVPSRDPWCRRTACWWGGGGPGPRVLLSVRPTLPRGGVGGWVWQNFRVGGCPPPPPGWGGTLWGPLGLSSQCHFFLSSVAGSV